MPSSTEPPIEWRFVDSVAAVGDWIDHHPLLSQRFLSCLEDSGGIDAEHGWQPQHLVARQAGETRAILPLYLKSHSMGEFVFDFAFARAYQQQQLDYYPKLLSMVPCTPVTVPRVLVADPTQAAALHQQALQILRQATPNAASSAHVLFLPESELAAYRDAGFLHRQDCQFHWFNQGYADFDHYLTTFTAQKRKKTKRERRRIEEMGIRLEWRRSDDLSDADWQRVYALKRLTFLRHGHEPYLPERFFTLVKERCPDACWVNLAHHGSELLAAAIFFKSHDTLYGRYWGATEAVHSLHFEVCYHQGIEFCIAHRLARFEPGTQGEHKIARGFTPTLTHSMHYFGEPAFQAAARHYFAQERQAVEQYQHSAQELLPFKSTVLNEQALRDWVQPRDAT